MATIAIDFDGTCVTHEYPKVGRDIGAVPVLKKLVENGHQLILFTMRSPIAHISDAIKWFDDNDIRLYAVNGNPTQNRWTSSSKALADLYIDDAGLGIPLCYTDGEPPYVDWVKVEKMLKNKALL